jgi:predicted dehydrogenase
VTPRARAGIGVIGCGYWGPNLIRNFSTLPDADVRVVCDLSTERLAHMRQLYPHVTTTTDAQAVMEDPRVDAVIIATPVRYHYPLARQALEANKHTLIEKPMASTVVQCAELNALAEAKDLTLMAGHTFLYSPVVWRIKEIVDAGELGDILYISSRRLNLGLFQRDINVAWDLAPHDLSIILHLLDEQPIAVNCQGRAHLTDIEVLTNMSLTFASGRFATIHSSWIDPAKVREMTIVGRNKMAVYDDTEPLDKLKIYDKHVEAPPHYDTFAEFHYSYHYGGMAAPYVKEVEPLRLECQDFLDCIRTRAIPQSSGRHGQRVVEILAASSASLEAGGARVEIGQTASAPTTVPRTAMMVETAAFAS